MNCDSCGRARRADARFCGGCGKPVVPRCGACGRETEPDAQFCDGCGASLVARGAASAETRKVVTIVFADLVGSTSLHERLDAESVRRFVDRYYQAMRGAVEAEGGTVTQLLGDGVMAVFGAPRVAEDDALRAVRAAVGMQHAFHALADAESGLVGQTGLRVAVNTGEVVASDQSEIIGDPVNVAARLQERGSDGDVVIGEATRRLVGDLVTLAPLGTFAVKGRGETVTAYRVVSLERPAGAATTAFVGRADELGRLTAVYEAAVAAPRARLAVVLGSPGLGKTRLLAELARRLGDAAIVLTAHCDATGAATFAPIAEALRTVLRLEVGATADAVRAALESMAAGDDAEHGRIAAGIAALLAGTPAPPEETFFVVRRFLAALAAAQPVVLALDDLQWAEPLLLDLTEHLAQWSTAVPLLILVAARPELRDLRSSLATPGALVAEVVTLAGLDAGAATRLAANVIGADELPAAIAGRVLAASEGNPLFVGELVRMLVHDGALKREADRWTTGVELAALEMPPTIHALLAARLERLGPEERTVLERAAVIGRQFSRAAVAHLLPRDLTDLHARLESLRRSELIESDVGWFLGEPALRFHHVLIRDAAYRRVLKGTRAELHGRFADWLETRVGEAVEHDETIGWHLEQAHRHLRELGPLDESGRMMGERAARYLAAAGRRALERDDVPLAASLLGRALERLDAADPARADLALDWCEALLAAGDVGAAARAIDELGRFIAGSERLRAWHACFAGQRAALTDPQALHATLDAVATAADTLAAAGDAAGQAKAHFVHAIALARLGRVGACEAALDRALAAARRGHDRRRANAVLAGAPLAALWGPSPVTRASGRCLDVVRVLRITQGAPAVEAVALRCQAVLEALRGRTEAARRMIASSRRLVEELGITQRLLEADVFAGLIELLEGDAVAAERSLRPAYEGLRANELGIDAAQAAALLGRALLAQGRAAEAEALSHESEALAGDDLQAAMAWRCVRAEALARRGEHAAAVEFARAAVALAAATDALLYHADARLALAAALRAAGRSDQAAAEEARAIELWDAKGATLLAERARRDLGRAEPVGHAADDRAGAARPTRRQVRANAATANVARLDAAIAARDADAVATVFADQMQHVSHHFAGVVYDRQGVLATWRSLLSARAPTCRHEPLATLGDSLALCRVSTSASAYADGKLDVGAYEREEIALIEAGSDERQRRAEAFPADHLGDAVARLYERYAELLPDGPARTRAAATARSVAALVGPPDPDRYAEAFAPAIEFVDHRRLVGFGSAHGAEAALQGFRTLLSLVDDVVGRVDDILGVQSDAFLMRWTTSGTIRASGGAYERNHVQLWTFGADGLATRVEWFDGEDEALARFDQRTARAAAAQFAAAPARAAERRGRVRPNAATAYATREDAAFLARDGDAFATLFADEREVVDHANGATFDQREYLTSLGPLLRAPDLTRRHEPWATLGDELALCRVSLSAPGISRGDYDVGVYEAEAILLIEVDARGRCRRTEIFAENRLVDAIARMYERYAEILAEGPAHTRAAATAHTVAALMAASPETIIATDCEYVDHRSLGFPALHGSEEIQRWVRSLFETAENVVFHTDDVLALQSDALVVRSTNVGTDRAGGGGFERRFIALHVFGVDGRLRRWEHFEVDRDAEALARFDALVHEPRAPRVATAPSRAVTRRVRPNAATTNAARTDTVIAARDTEALPDLFADEMRAENHITHTAWDRPAVLSSWRSLLRAQDPTCRHEPLATLGDSLALCRLSTSASGFAGRTFDVGAYQREEIVLIEVDAKRRRRLTEVFAPDHLGDAVARLYEGSAELFPDSPARDRAAATARSVAVILGPPDLEGLGAALAPALAPDLAFVDHRRVGVGTMDGAETWLASLRALVHITESYANRVDDVLGLRSDAFLVRWTNFGRDRAGGGAYERPFIFLWVFGPDGRATRAEQFDLDREADALARFDALAAEAAPACSMPSRAAETRARRVRANAATAHAARLEVALASRDADLLPTLFAEELEGVDHPTGATVDREGHLSSWRLLLAADDPACRFEPLATLGDALALCHFAMSARGFADGGFETGAVEKDEVVLIEVDTRGRRRRGEYFAPARLGDAVVRLYEWYAELLPDGPARARAAATARSIAAVLGPVDVDRYATAFAPAVESVDHRILGTWSARGAEALLQHYRSVLELADDVAIRNDEILGLRSDALLLRRTHHGTARAGGGAYERQHLALSGFGADGLLTRNELFDCDREAGALARFDALTSEAPTPRFENAATRVVDRIRDTWAARDWDGFAALFPAGFRSSDRRTLMHLELDRDEMLRGMRAIFEMASSLSSKTEVLATRGNRLALTRFCTGGAEGPSGRGPTEIEFLQLNEVDAGGHHVAAVGFDPDDLDAAYAELDERYAAGEAAPSARTWEKWVQLTGAAAARDWEQLTAVFAPDLFIEDQRPIGVLSFRSRDEYVASVRALVDLRPDARLRIDHVLALDDRRSLTVVRWEGSGEGAFQIPAVVVGWLGTDGLVRRLQPYNLEQLDEAFACYEAIAATTAADPLCIPPNAVIRAGDRWVACLESRDWKALADVFAPMVVFEDRRRLIRTAGGRDMVIANAREVAAMMTWRVSRTPLATAGDRLALEHVLFRAGDDAPVEVETLHLAEVDAKGRFVAVIVFDPDDRRAAFAEVQARFLAGEAAAIGGQAPIAAFDRAFAQHDWDSLRACLANDLVSRHHRELGLLGALPRNEWIDSLRVQADLAPDVGAETHRILVSNCHGRVDATRVFGTMREGGPFENVFLRVIVTGGDRIQHYEVFDIDAADRALARFEELCA